MNLVHPVAMRCTCEVIRLHLGHVTGDMKRRESNETLSPKHGTALNTHNDFIGRYKESFLRVRWHFVKYSRLILLYSDMVP